MRHVAFLRAVNVGGRTIKMERLKASFEELDLAGVTTFIASGNVVFDSRRGAASLERAIEARLEADFGFSVTTMIRSIDELQGIQTHISTRLQPPADVSLYVGFLKAVPTAAAARAVVALSNAIDRLSIDGRQLYWWARQGLGQSTLSAARVEKLLATPATLRNVNTIDRIVQKFANG